MTIFVIADVLKVRHNHAISSSSIVAFLLYESVCFFCETVQLLVMVSKLL